MRVIVALEHRFERTADGAVWSGKQFGRPFWDRYLDVFDQVAVVARVRGVTSVGCDATRVDDEDVTVVPVPHYLGPWQYLTRLVSIRHAARAAVHDPDAVILHTPGVIASQVAAACQRAGHPYAVEVVGDPHEAFARRANTHPLRPVFRWWFTRQLRRQCAQAVAAAYVSGGILPHRYPCRAFSTTFSSILLLDEAFAAAPRTGRLLGATPRVVVVGSLEQPYKGVDVLIDAIARCATIGARLELVVVGDGRYRPRLQEHASQTGMGDRVRFLRQLPPGAAVREQLDRSDIFVLPSRTEGLPRAMIEAMARGLPCIGTSVGGIPELLPAEDLVPPDDARALASTIRAVVTRPERMAAMSARNLAKAREYHNGILQERRVAFYRHIRDRTERWIAGTP